MPPRRIQIPRDSLLDKIHNNSDSEADRPMESPHCHENGNPLDQPNNTQEGIEGARPTANNEAPAPPPNTAPEASQAGGNLRQAVNQMIALRKLDDNAQQDLNRYAKASPVVRDVMQYSLDLELRQETQKITNAVVSSGVHSDLLTNAKAYTAAVFFSPNLTFYRAPCSGAQSGALQKLVLSAMRKNHVAHMPSQSDKAGIDKLMVLIGTYFTDYRSATKSILEKRKNGEPEMDLGSLVARATKNTGVRVTAQHYGRFAFLSRQMDAYNKRARTNTETGQSDGVVYWDWVDEALANVRQEVGASQKDVDKYFRKVLEQDEVKWSKAVGELHETAELEEWQRVAQRKAQLLAS